MATIFGEVKMKDGTEEKIINQVVQCNGFRKLMTIETCQNNCDMFGGIHKEPVEGRSEKGKREVIDHNYYIKCNRPRLLPFMQIGEISSLIKNKEG